MRLDNIAKRLFSVLLLLPLTACGGGAGTTTELSQPAGAAANASAAPSAQASQAGTSAAQPPAAAGVGIAAAGPGAAAAGQSASVGGVAVAPGTAAAPSSAAAAGSSAPVTPSTPMSSGAADASWCGVKQTLDAHCTVCHNEQKTAGAPMSLKTFADLTAPAVSDPTRKVYELVKVRVHDKMRPMPPQDKLSDEQLAGIDAFVDSVPGLAVGAAASGDISCAGSTMTTSTTAAHEWPPKNCDAMYTVRAAPESAKNKIAAGAETHPQTDVMAPWGNDEVQAIAWKSLNDNIKVLHHWILYGPQSEFLFGWAPGKDYNNPLPNDVGVYLPKGMLHLDMHYNNIAGTAEEQDASGVEICVLKKANFRPKTATITMALSPSSISIAPHAVDQTVTGVCTHMGAPVRLLSASPHAHKNANHMKFTVERAAGGAPIVMHDADFDFNEQTTYPLDPPLEIKDGDKITTTCTFTNDTNQTITFGENTGNEMCFNFAMYEPMGGLSCGGGGGMFPTF